MKRKRILWAFEDDVVLGAEQAVVSFPLARPSGNRTTSLVVETRADDGPLLVRTLQLMIFNASGC